MFPYLKSIKEFIQDCETISHEIEYNKKTGLYECKKNRKRTNESWSGCDKAKNNCKNCNRVTDLVAWLIQNVDQANWGKNKKYGVRTVAFSEVGAWCRSLCDAMYEVLKPLENKNLIVGLEYYLEDRQQADKTGKSHNRVDVMIGGYGINDEIIEKRLLVIELKQYSEVLWSKDGHNITYFYNNDKCTEESPNYQVKFYCDSMDDSMQKAGVSLKILPVVFMHNLFFDKIRTGSFDKGNIQYNKQENYIYDNDAKFGKTAIRTYVADKNKKDKYLSFRDFIQSIFDYDGNDVDALEVFRTLKKGYTVLSPENLADMLICDDPSKYIPMLRPDQYFAMYGYGESNYDWDNYLKNHVDFLYYFKNSRNRDYWKDLIKKPGILDVVEGGPGSGKSVLAMLLIRYCLDRKLSVAYVFTGSAQVNKVMDILTGALKDKLNGMLPQELEHVEIFQDLVNNISKSKLGKFAKFKGEKEKTRFSIMPFSGLTSKNNQDCDVYIIDDAHNAQEKYTKKNPGKSNKELIEELTNSGKLVVMFYDRHQIIEKPKEKEAEEVQKRSKEYHDFIGRIIDDGKEKELVEKDNSFHLWSMFRCNKNEGYLTWIENELEIGYPVDDNDMNLFDFDVKILDKKQVKTLSSQIVNSHHSGNENTLLVLSESDNTKKLEELLGQKVVIFKDKNGKMGPIDKNGAINIGKALKIRGVETERVLVIIDDRITKRRNEKEDTTYLRNCYRVLLTRGLKECNIYVCDEGLRKQMVKSLEEVNRFL